MAAISPTEGRPFARATGAHQRWKILRRNSTIIDNYYVNDYYYSRSDSLLVFLHPWFYYNSQCPNEIFQPQIFISGACVGPYSFHWSPSTGLSNDTIPDPYITVGDSTIYNCSVTDANGLNSNLTFISNPIIQAEISVDSTSCPGCLPILSTHYYPYYNYYWFRDNSLIPSSDTNSITANTTGNYRVVIFINANCKDTSGVMYISFNSIKENITAAKISISPNPSSGISLLKIFSPGNENYNITIHSMIGSKNELLFSVIKTNSRLIEFPIDAKNYKPGMYIISVQSETQNWNSLWIVE